MTEPDKTDAAAIQAQLHSQAQSDLMRITVHAHQEMAEDAVSM